MKKLEIKIKNWIFKNFFFKRLYLILKILKKSKKRYHYGENGEDVIIGNLFNHNKKGFYIDVGCYHPIRASLTHLLYKKGWSGINIDISEDTIKLFDIARPKDKNLNIGISNNIGQDHYYQSGKINQANSFKFYKNAKQVRVEVTTLDEIINKFGIKKIDFLNIDAEYKDFEVLQGINLNSIRPTLITIEDTDGYDFEDVRESNIYKYLTNKNYFLFSRTYCTSFYLDKKIKHKLESILNTRSQNSL